MKVPCYQHDSYHRECSSCVEMNATKPSSAVSRSGEEEAREWLESEWPHLHPDLEKWRGFITNMFLPLHAAHVRKQERERSIHVMRSMCVGRLEVDVMEEVAAAIREGE